MDAKIAMVILACVVLVLLVYLTRRRKRWPGLFLFLFTVLFVLLVAEMIYRGFFREPPVISTVNDYYRQDSTIGFHFDPGVIPAVEYREGGDTIYHTTYSIIADTNHLGIDYPMRRAFHSDTSSLEIVFLGCSFTFGEGLPDEETLPYEFGRLTGFSTVNRACNGLGVHQVFALFMSEYAKRDNRHRIFIYPYFSEHIFRALGLYTWNVAGPYFTLAGDSLVNHGPFYHNKRVYGHRLARAASLLGTFSFVQDYIERAALKMAKRRLKEKDFAPEYEMFRQLAAAAENTGSRMIFLNWDDPPVNTGSKWLDSAIAGNRVRSEVSSTNALVLQVSSAMDRSNPEYYIPRDGHPNGKANRLIATFLSKHVGH